MKKLLTERTFKRLLKTFINENINDVSSDSIRNWALKNFNKNANTNYEPDYLANIAIDVLKVLKPNNIKINGKAVDILQIKTDEELKNLIKLIDDTKARLSSTSIGGFGNVNKGVGGVDFSKLTPKEKFKLIKKYHTNAKELFKDGISIPVDRFKYIEDAFDTNNERSPKIPYAVWYSLLIIQGVLEVQRAEDAPLIADFITIFNTHKEMFDIDNVLKIKTRYDYDKFYNKAREIQSSESGLDKSQGSAHVSTLIKKYGPSSEYPLYKGDFKDEKYGNTYAFFLIPILKEDEIDIYQPILREIGMETTWCFAYGWADGKKDNKTFIKTYCTQDTTRILINKADPFNSVNGKFAMNKIDSQFMNINDQPVLG
jgi:hypothetical protein